MKKNLGLMVMVLVALFIMPLSVNASIKLGDNADCTVNDKLHTCSFKITIDNDNVTEKTITLTPAGGAVINSATIRDDASLDWEIKNIDKATVNGVEVWNVTVKTADNKAKTKWDGKIFDYTYTESGTKDCAVTYSIGSAPATPTPQTPEKNPQTGSTLPYIALGAIVLVATAAYVTTRNKSKMYKI